MKPTYVRFEQAKILKEKVFDVECKHYYELAITSKKDKQDGYSGAFGWKKGECNLQSGFFINDWKNSDYSNKTWFLCAAPEQWQVIEWLRVNHGIWVYCEVVGDKFYCKAKKLKSNWRRVVSGTTDGENNIYNTPQEAYSAAFDYILNNLI